MSTKMAAGRKLRKLGNLLSESFFDYDTPKMVQIKSWKAGAVNRIVQLLIILYAFGLNRKRCPDYTDLETLTLIEFVSTHKALLFGNGGKGSSKEEKMKERYWMKAASVLQSAGGHVREWRQIRKKWRDLSSKAKAYKAPKTGGGPPVLENPLFEKVLGVLAKEVVSGILSEEDMASSQETVCSDPASEADAPTPAPTVPSLVPPASLPTASVRRPATVQQCRIQEELLDIQKALLAVQREQVSVLKCISNSLRDNSSSAIHMFNDMQGI